MASQEKRAHKVPPFLKGLIPDGKGAGDELERKKK